MTARTTFPASREEWLARGWVTEDGTLTETCIDDVTALCLRHRARCRGTCDQRNTFFFIAHHAKTVEEVRTCVRDLSPSSWAELGEKELPQRLGPKVPAETTAVLRRHGYMRPDLSITEKGIAAELRRSRAHQETCQGCEDWQLHVPDAELVLLLRRAYRRPDA